MRRGILSIGDSRKIICKGLCIFLLCQFSFLLAQEQEEVRAEVTVVDIFQIFARQELVWAASKQEIELGEAPVAVSVITARDIERMQVLNISEIFRGVPGMHLNTLSDFQAVVGIRGFQTLGSTKTLVLIDGLPLSLDFFGVTMWNLLPLNVEDIERIEILRSPSTIYGANAFGGVINIVTKNYTGPLSFQAKYSTGTGHTNKLHVSGGGQRQSLTYRSSLQSYRTDIWAPEPKQFFSLDHAGNERENDRLILSSRLGVDLDRRGTLEFSFGYGGLDNTTMVLPPGRKMLVDGNMFYVLGGYSRSFGIDSTVKALVSLNSYDLTHHIHPGMAHSNVTEKTTDVYVEHSFSWGTLSDHRLLYGGNIYNKNADRSPDNPLGAPLSLPNPGITQEAITRNVNKTGGGFFIQNQYQLPQNVTLHTGGRYDRHFFSGQRFAPFAAVVFNPEPNRSFRFNTHTAFRFPNIYELFGDLALNTAPRGPGVFSLRGNEDLKPERVTSVELGYGDLLFNRLRVSANFFRNNFGNRILIEPFRKLAFGPRQIPLVNGQYTNFKKGHAYGFELSGDLLIGEMFSLKANYSYHALREDIVGFSEEAPKNSVYVAFAFGTRRYFDGLLEYYYKSRARWTFFDPGDVRDIIDPFNLVNLNLSSPIVRNFRLDLTGFNLLNNRHRDFVPPFGQTLGRRFTVSLSLIFGEDLP